MKLTNGVTLCGLSFCLSWYLCTGIVLQILYVDSFKDNSCILYLAKKKRINPNLEALGSSAVNLYQSQVPRKLTDLDISPTAPKLQGRPRKKRKKPTDSESESSETSEDIRPRLKGKPGLTAKPNGLRVLDRKSSSRAHLSQVKNDFSTPALNRLIEVDFMSKLHKFMKDRSTPITRLPHIGYKQCKYYAYAFIIIDLEFGL